MQLSLRPLIIAVALAVLYPDPLLGQTPARGAAGGARTTLARLLDDHWSWTLRNSPVFATTFGVRTYDRQLGDLTLAGADQRVREAATFLARLERIDTRSLTTSDRVTHAILRRDLKERVDESRYGHRAVLFTTYSGWHTSFADLPDRHPFRSRADLEAYLARLEAFPAYNRGGIATTRTALAGGFAQPCAPFEGYERTISGAIATEPQGSRFFAPLRRRPQLGSETPWATAAEWEAYETRALRAIRDSVYPAYRELLRFYREEYQPKCRAVAGVSSTPQGAAYYAHRLRAESTTELTAEQIHPLGLSEVARIRAEMDTVAARAGFPDRKSFVEHLRTDPRYYAKTPEELLSAAATIAKRIDGEMPRLFGRLPRLPYTVRPIPAAVAEGTTTAYYGRGSAEAKRPGTYWVNTSKLDQRPLFELPALTIHEAVPGHHHQISLNQELDLPLYRRHVASSTAFTEGWGLYSERLGIEMGLYDTPAKDMGRLSYEMWRACRLVVDTGIHAKGWTRDQAIAYMLDNTALSRGNVEAEVNRYITWPGQAVAYKLGELKIRELRARAEARLGARFELAAFHDAVLENGAVPLDVLEAHVEAWMARRLAR